jgi:hypothetical protein
MDVSGAINLANNWNNIKNQDLGTGIAKGLGFYGVGAGQAALTYYLGPVGGIAAIHVGGMLNSLVKSGNFDDYTENIGEYTALSALMASVSPFGAAIAGSVTKGIEDDVLKSLIRNVLSNNLTLLFADESKSLWSGTKSSFENLKDGFNNFIGVGLPWFQWPWLQASAVAGSQTNMEFNDYRYGHIKFLQDEYESNKSIRPDFINNNSFGTDGLMRFVLQQDIWIYNTFHPDIYNLNNPIYTPVSPLPAPAVIFNFPNN